MFAKLLLPLLLAAALAPSARAGSSIELHFGKRTHNGNFVVSLSSGPHGYANYCAPKKVWVPAHFETQTQQVWVEGVEQKVWIAPVYGWRYDHCGKPYKVQLEVGHWKCVGSPGHFESQRVQVWVCGHWESCG